MDVSVIIVNYKTSSLTRQTIRSVIEHTIDIEYEIIVVDNNSQDSSADDIGREFGETIKLLVLPENIGFGRANNEGVEVAEGRNVFFLNPDTLLLNNAIKILSDGLDLNTNYGIVGGNLYDINGRPCHSHMSLMPGIFTELDEMFFGLLSKLFLGGSYQFNKTEKNIKVGYITGADLMISKELFLKIGRFNPLFFMYYEETELCYRVHNIGLNVINIPQSKIIHLEGASFNSEKALSRFDRLYKGREVYYKLTHKRWHKSIADAIYIANGMVKSVMYLFLCNAEKYKLYKERLKYLIGKMQTHS